MLFNLSKPVPFLQSEYQQNWAESLNGLAASMRETCFFFLIVFQISIAKFVHEAAKTQLTGESKAAVEDDFKCAWDT